MTKPHVKIIRMVRELKLSYKVEEPFGKYWIDVYLPEFHIGIEADGPYHFRKRDEKRDKFLFDEYALPVLRIGHKEMGNIKSDREVKHRIIEFIEQWVMDLDERLDQLKSKTQA